MKRLARQLILCFFLCIPVTHAIADTAVVIDEQQLQQLQDKMLNDPRIMELILALQNDPEMLSLLNDPSFLQAVRSRDVGKLERDSRFTKLLNNKNIRQIIERLQ
jgi:hypothetical protein